MSNKKITFKGNPLTIEGAALEVGQKFPAFKLTANDMSDLESTSFAGKPLVVLALPSLDTPVCSVETKHFNQEASKLSADLTVLVVSMDLPFAQKRWCAAEGVERVITASDYKYHNFGKATGTQIKEWGLFARAVFVVDAQGVIRYSEYVSDVSSEPDYAAALVGIKQVL